MDVGLINGLPGHPLFVHGAVVLVPLTVLALLLCALWPAAARRFGWVLPALGLLTLVLVVLTTESGEWLEERVRETALVEKHADMGSDLTPWVIALFVLTVAVWLIGHAGARRERERSSVPGSPPQGGVSTAVRLASSVPARVVALVLALVVAFGAVIDAYRIGDSGAKAAWHGRFSTSESSRR
ncbi:DUF2231 domain-containing protein [Streptomyces sp. NK08204]|uniref:DUF2231 domain-containing protein n=1 Tax=Streptomyces sp. NK08204 TaxID=2873260 RepID=UPI001CED2E3B|nr:DUF2231 domain-containing protein [Streptomyces sp. NK08204]